MLREVVLGNVAQNAGDKMPTDEIKRISDSIAELVAEKRISLTEIADLAGVAPSTIASLANPDGARGSNPRASTLKKIKDAYPSFMSQGEYVETQITGHCYFGKVNPPRAMESSSVALRTSGMMDFGTMGIVVVKRTSAPRAQSVFEGAYFFHKKSPADAVNPEDALGQFCVVYERRDDEVAAGGVWLGVLEKRPGTDDYVMVSVGGDGEQANTVKNPLIIAPKVARGLNIEWVMPVHGIWMKAQLDAFRAKEDDEFGGGI